MHKVPTTLLYSLEGMAGLDWEKLLKLQSQDGSFMTSPASTAYALMQTRDPSCMAYLAKVVHKFNGGGSSSPPPFNKKNHPFELHAVCSNLIKLLVERGFKIFIPYLYICIFICLLVFFFLFSPNVYPVDLFEHVWTVDRLQRLGISRYFEPQLKECIDYVNRYA